MKAAVYFVGIDVGSSELVVEMKSEINGEISQGIFDNTREGHNKLIKFITKGGKTARVCMEATGIYHIDLAVALARSGKVEVMVVNPKSMKNFGTAMMQRAKTDKIDAHMILEYLLRMDFVLWRLPSKTALQIHALSRRLFQLKQEITREKNRLSAAEFSDSIDKKIVKSIKKHIEFMKKQCLEVQQVVMALINEDEALMKKFSQLVSITGIAELSAIQILAEMLFLSEDIEPDQLTAFAGLDPKTVESGSSINKPRHISRHGNKFLRSALYMPAWVAVLNDTHVKAYYDKLIKNGKKKMQAIVAVMRKLLRSICGMLKSNTEWIGEKFYKIQ
ncbi:MAG: IS110 family transposase [Gammaproteobacteria bacterium]|nr:IS110 family transposase [Gammaproteobacteria bacterium]